jgi:hypothetical protein
MHGDGASCLPNREAHDAAEEVRNILIRYTGYTKIIRYHMTNQVNIGLVTSNPNPSIATQSAVLCQYDP